MVERARWRAPLTAVGVVASRSATLRRGEAEHVPEEKRGGLARREPLQSGDEGELDRRTPLVAGLGAGCRIGYLLEQGVRVRLKPGHLAQARGFGRHEGRGGRGGRPPTGIPDRVATPVRRDPVQPGPHRGAALEVGQAAPRRQERLLEHVLRVGERAEEAVAVDSQLGSVRLDQLAERVRIESVAHVRIVPGACRPFRFRAGGCLYP
jgi:hypothetical protein